MNINKEWNTYKTEFTLEIERKTLEIRYNTNRNVVWLYATNNPRPIIIFSQFSKQETGVF